MPVTNENLHEALKNKNNEFYTLLSDVEKECQHYIAHYYNKIIYLNCDNENSAFWQYFYTHFNEFGLKQLIATHMSNQPYALSTVDGITVKKVMLQGSGSFNSLECQTILESADLIITNPPFSLFRQWVMQAEAANKKYLLIGNENTFASTEIFPLIKDNKLWTGYNHVSVFNTPDGSQQSFGNICWFTNLTNDKDIPLLTLSMDYDIQKHLKYDNFDAINVDRLSEIPKNYSGIIGVPVSYLTKHNPLQFDIIGLAAGNTRAHKLNFEVPYYPHPLDRGGCGVINGIRKYSRVFIKRK